jgi:hypothetical protein
MVQTRNAAAVAADPIINAVVSPEASLVARDLLEMVLANSVALPPAWEATLQALLANVLMNDYLNWWNKAGQKELDAAKVAADRAINLNSNLALGYHARGLVHRAEGDPQGASDDFQHARTLDSSCPRPAQVANQKHVASAAVFLRGYVIVRKSPRRIPQSVMLIGVRVEHTERGSGFRNHRLQQSVQNYQRFDTTAVI